MSIAQSFKIKTHEISRSNPPYIIAEISANHNKSLDRILKMLAIAKDCGVDAVKIQTYTPDTITLNCKNPEFLITEGLWKGNSLYELYQKAYLPWEWHESIFRCADDLGLTLFSSPFDLSAVDFLENLNVPAYKIASFELTDHRLLKYVACKGKPVILSTGMASIKEIEDSVFILKSSGCKQIALLHCVSSYPARHADYNVTKVADLRSRFNLEIGLSDHSDTNITALTSIALGASLIEKHFTLNKSAGGPDDSFSIEPDELRALCRDSRVAWETLGQPSYSPIASELKNQLHRRSIYLSSDVSIGDSVNENNIKVVRPGLGLPSAYYDQLIGMKFNRSIPFGTPMKWEYVD